MERQLRDGEDFPPTRNILNSSQSHEVAIQKALPPDLKAISSPDHEVQQLEIQLHQPAEAHGTDVDRHTPSPTSQREGRTTWMVVYHVVCLLAVVAIWSATLLPPILTYSLSRSPLLEPLEEAYTVNLTSTTPNCSMYTEDMESSGISSLNQSGLATPSTPGNCSATGSNLSRECSDGFYLHRELDSCRPQCGIWEPRRSSTALEILVIIATSISIILGIAVLVISALQWKQVFVFPTIFWVFMTIDTILYNLFWILGITNQAWFCTSVDLIENILNASPYCTLSGILPTYLFFQQILLAVFFMALLFWAVMFPFQYQTFKNAGHFIYVYTAMVIAAILLPCLPALINLAFEYGITDFPVTLCIAASQGVAFFTESIPEAINVAVVGTLLVLVFLDLLKHSIKKTKKGNWAVHLTAKQRWIPLFMWFVLIVGCTNSVTTAYTSATLNSSKQILQDYFRCESAGRQMNCSDEEIVNAMQTIQVLYATVTVLGSFFPIFILILVVNIKELKRTCKHMNAVFHSDCLHQQTWQK